MKQYKIFSPTTMLCTNCSLTGHQSKQCPQPITSYGVIVFRIKGPWNQADELVSGALTGLENVLSNIEYLLIQRRDTIAFIELMRGKYRVIDKEYIQQLIGSMTKEEHTKLISQSFYNLLERLWGPTKEGSHAYKNEKEQAKQKFESITEVLEECIKECQTPWTSTEWGFPKGRRDIGESEYACAMRELWEETNIYEKDIYPIRNMDPIREIFYGTNGVQYCHKYYIAYAPAGIGEETIENAALTNEHITREVGQVKWFSLNDAIQHIRPENTEKRQLLLRIHQILQKYCPLAVVNPIMKTSV
jgi:8-oxo-dGTP pyrophosphatase MutT (NUDIX family)